MTEMFLYPVQTPWCMRPLSACTTVFCFETQNSIQAQDVKAMLDSTQLCYEEPDGNGVFDF